MIYLGIEHGGLLRSLDGGETWEDLSRGLEHNDVHMVASDPIWPNVVYVAEARGFYRSDNQGHGWTRWVNGLTRDYVHDFFVLHGPNSTLFLATANGSPPSWMRDGKAQSAIFRSNDCGATWHQLRGGLPESMERMVWNLVGDPADPARLYAGCGEYSRSHTGRVGGEVWASADLGTTWARVAGYWSRNGSTMSEAFNSLSMPDRVRGNGSHSTHPACTLCSRSSA